MFLKPISLNKGCIYFVRKKLFCFKASVKWFMYIFIYIVYLSIPECKLDSYRYSISDFKYQNAFLLTNVVEMPK
jgi:hypothetical protein